MNKGSVPISPGNDAATVIKECAGVPKGDRAKNFPHPADALRNGNLRIGATHVGLHPPGMEDGHFHLPLGARSMAAL